MGVKVGNTLFTSEVITNISLNNYPREGGQNILTKLVLAIHLLEEQNIPRKVLRAGLKKTCLHV